MRLLKATCSRVIVSLLKKIKILILRFQKVRDELGKITEVINSTSTNKFYLESLYLSEYQKHYSTLSTLSKEIVLSDVSTSGISSFHTADANFTSSHTNDLLINAELALKA